jgi:hypothetical protein
MVLLHAHNGILVSKLNPLSDEINALGDRLNRMNIQQTLDKWRLDCHKKIDYFFEQKCQELEQTITAKTDGQ